MGRRRSIVEAAANHSLISVEIANRKCGHCGNIAHTLLCDKCGEKTELKPVCPKCGIEANGNTCPSCKGKLNFSLGEALLYENTSLVQKEDWLSQSFQSQ